MSHKWQRPTHVTYPNVWATFKGNVKENGKYLEYIIQDVTEDMHEDVLQHMVRYFLVREPMCSTLGIVEDEQSKQDITEFWRDCLKQRMSLVALVKDKDGTGKQRIAGCNMLCVCTEDDVPKKFSGEIMNKVLTALEKIASASDVYKRHGISEYLSAYGLSVSPAYSGDGVGLQLLRAREPLCRAMGVKLTGTVFTADTSQYLASKAGFSIVCRQQYNEFSVDNEIIFRKLNDKTYAFMEKLFL